MNEFFGKTPMAALAVLRRLLFCAGDDDARADSRLLLCWATGLTMEQIAASTAPLTESEAEKLQKGVLRRRGGEPVQYIIGQAYFCGRPFSVSPGVLIPRRDTETLVSAAVGCIHPGDRVLDLCCGSGCIGITLALETGARVWAGDISPQACTAARANAKALGADVEVRRGDLFSPFTGMAFDVIASNPPYIGEQEPVEDLVRENEPSLALYGGADGLDYYRRIIPLALRHLCAGGYLILEHGAGQSKALCALLVREGYLGIEIHRDMENRPRVVSARKGKS